MVLVVAERVDLRSEDPGLGVSALRLRWAILALIVIYGMASILARRSLFADGSFFFIEIVSTQKNYLIQYREFAGLVAQAPLLLGLSWGWRDGYGLHLLWGLGLIGVPLLLWFYALTRSILSDRFWVFLYFFSVIYFTSGFFSIGEYNIGYACVAACASILCRIRLRLPELAALFALAVFSISIYELSVLAAPLLALSCGLRLRSDRLRLSWLARALLLLSSVAFLVATARAMVSILDPRVPASLEDAARGVSALISAPLLYGACIAGLAVMVSLIGLPHAVRRLAVVLALMLSTLVVLVPGLEVTPGLSVAMRAVLVVPMAGGLLLLLSRQLVPAALCWSWFRFNSATIAVVLACFLAFGLNASLETWNFSRWLSLFEQELAQVSGAVPVDRSALALTLLQDRYGWPWSTTSLSYALGGDRRHLLTNASAYQGWQPDLSALVDSAPLVHVRRH